MISRATNDVDVLDEKILPEAVLESSKAFARERSIPENWLNNDVTSLQRDLPAGWKARRVEVFRGRAIRLLSLGRSDLLKAKLWALCDRARDRSDVVALKPTSDELREAREWLIPLDGNPLWSDHVDQTLNEVDRSMGLEHKHD